MNTAHAQRGGIYNTLFLLALLGATVLLGLKVIPVYMNQAKINQAVSAIADSPNYKDAPIAKIRNDLQRRWDVDDVKHMKVNEIKLERTPTGRELHYDYEVRLELIANWDLVLTFNKTYPMYVGG